MPIYLSFFAPIVTLVAACIGATILWRIHMRNSLRSAATSFRAAFSDTMSQLRNNHTTDVSAILETCFSAHESAVLEFRVYLSKLESKSFMEAWHNYYCHDGNPSIPFLEQYSKHLGSIEFAKTNRKRAIQRIEHLLTYAKQT